MDQKLHGWFTERSPMWPGQAFSLEKMRSIGNFRNRTKSPHRTMSPRFTVNKILLDKKSKYQHILIFESASYGRVLALDGVLQLTERDEFSYQEMMAFLPLNSHPCPEKVLVIGGGDGGVVREVAKHPSVKKIVMCEIDEEVISACKEHIPSVSCGFSDPRLTLHIGDGLDFLQSCTEQFDVIITDASDPVVPDEENDSKDGPATSLFNEEYYTRLHERLAPNGILTSQGESMWLHKDLIGRLVRKSRLVFPVVQYAYTCTPSYPCGQIGLIMCSKNPMTKFSEPVTRWSEEDVDRLKLRYYSSAIHAAAFVLPTFIRQFLDKL